MESRSVIVLNRTLLLFSDEIINFIIRFYRHTPIICSEIKRFSTTYHINLAILWNDEIDFNEDRKE